MVRVHPFETDAAKQLFEAIGRALSAWNFVERDLSALFCDCVHFGSDFPGRRAYWSIHSFEIRLDAIDELLTCQLFGHPKYLAQWNALKNRLSRRAKLRNKLAHGSVFNRHPLGDTSGKPHLFLSPFDDVIYAQAYPYTKEQVERYFSKGLPKDRLYARDILEMVRTFNNDAYDISEFRRRVKRALRAATSRQQVASKKRSRTGGRRAKRPTPKES